MRTKPELRFDPAAVAQLACPACRGNLRANPANLVCGSCARAYPILDGIPVLIAERAQDAAPEQSRAKDE
jgi:uncharacterized protein